ncbi:MULTISPECIES: glycosyltransferase family 2 protein [Rhodomicrobium]|uniref:glycosyltransferase family 2 protein n=1 Tax=Rhodomicrobium TaxID=1068 RepID=UPI000B4A60FB|nr:MULTISPECIES: glycosyltransferase family 2 protein [Rhodomicrobium]
MITVIIPVYNNEQTLDAAVDSVVRQSIFRDIRVLICDDASTDRSAEKAAAWAARHDNIELLVNPANLGVMGNYRKLLDLCDSAFVAPLEADDVWTSNTRLQILAAFLARSEAPSCFNRFLIRDGGRYRLGAAQLHPERYSRLSAFDLIEENYPASFTNCFYKTSVFRDILADTQESFGYDWMVNTIMAARGLGMDFFPAVLSTYHISPNGAWSSLDRGRKISKTLETLLAMQTHLPARYSQNIGRRADALRREVANA